MSGTSAGTAPAPRSVRRARRGLFVYLALVLLLSAPVEGWMLGRGLPIGEQVVAVYLLMWIPAIASLLARLLLREGFADVSFRLGARGSFRWYGVALLFPIPVGLLSYGLAWRGGLVPFVLPDQVGGGPATAGKFLLVLLVVATVGTVLSCLSALGEEIGWRGYMLSRLVEADLPQPVLLGGLAWAAWHLPLILSGQYAQAGNRLASASLFVLVVVVVSYLFARVRLETGSVWPAVLLHASWNAIIQAAFDGFTGGPNRWTGESGLLTFAATALFVFLLCRGRWTARSSPSDPAPRTLSPSSL
jgi:membrane protease YdiL (CAAX protease family)